MEIAKQMRRGLKEQNSLNRAKIKGNISKMNSEFLQYKNQAKKMSESLKGDKRLSFARIPLPTTVVQEFPCDPRAFTIIKDNIVSAWQEVMFILSRFGKMVEIAKGKRKELQNVKVVIEKPDPILAPELEKYGFTEDQVAAYQLHILSGDLPKDLTYTYGHRIREHFGIDGLRRASDLLRNDNETRKAYIALWDTRSDMSIESPPCLVSLYFRKSGDKLTLTVMFRTHNAAYAWVYNVYGLKAILDFVAERTGLEPGAITVISQVLSLQDKDVARAEQVVKDSRHFALTRDPHGYFTICLDHAFGEIVVKHHAPEGLLLQEYRANRAKLLQYQLADNMAVSNINHAIYLGRQLAKAEMALKSGSEFVQE